MRGCLAAAMMFVCICAAAGGGDVVVTKYVRANTGKDVSDAIQKVIDRNPNRTIYFPDGEYVISKPIVTPADPEKSVALQLSNYAVIRASDDWSDSEAMIRLGGKDPANNIRKDGSNYFLAGGIIDGNGRADGVSIDGGRETIVRDCSIKHTRLGLHIKYGANSGSSDCDIHDVNIVCADRADCVGILVEGYDNTITNVRISGALIGVRLVSAGNYLRNVHLCSTTDLRTTRRASLSSAKATTTGSTSATATSLRPASSTTATKTSSTTASCIGTTTPASATLRSSPQASSTHT